MTTERDHKEREAGQQSTHPTEESGIGDFCEAETVGSPGSVYGPGVEFEISTVLAKAGRLLESNTPFGKVLHQNIGILYKAMEAEK